MSFKFLCGNDYDSTGGTYSEVSMDVNVNGHAAESCAQNCSGNCNTDGIAEKCSNGTTYNYYTCFPMIQYESSSNNVLCKISGKWTVRSRNDNNTDYECYPMAYQAQYQDEEETEEESGGLRGLFESQLR